jgi:LL-diaminopimelate aminotransferase
MILSKRMEPISSYFFAEVNRKIADLTNAGKDIIRLDIGSPDLPPPKPVIEKLCQSTMISTSHGYQSHKGTQEFREAWQAFYARQFDVDIDPDNEIIPLIGSKEGIFHFSLMMINPGDIVLIPDLHYPTYLSGTLFAEGQPYYFPLRWEDDYLPDLAAIPEDVASQAKMMWVNYPNNPTGATASPDFYRDLNEWAEKYDILLCSDLAYCQVYYNGTPPPSIFQVPRAKEYAIEFNSLSKSYNMAGWRVGALVGKSDLIKKFLALKSNLDSGSVGPIMEAAACALQTDHSWIKERNRIYRQRRDLIVDAYKEIDVPIIIPQAGLYIWVSIPEDQSSEQFVLNLLNETGVSIAPGTVFGKSGEGFCRISFVQSNERIAEAMQRVKGWWA